MVTIDTFEQFALNLCDAITYMERLSALSEQINRLMDDVHVAFPDENSAHVTEFIDASENLVAWLNSEICDIGKHCDESYHNFKREIAIEQGLIRAKVHKV